MSVFGAEKARPRPARLSYREWLVKEPGLRVETAREREERRAISGLLGGWHAAYRAHLQQHDEREERQREERQRRARVRRERERRRAQFELERAGRLEDQRRHEHERDQQRLSAEQALRRSAELKRRQREAWAARSDERALAELQAGERRQLRRARFALLIAGSSVVPLGSVLGLESDLDFSLILDPASGLEALAGTAAGDWGIDAVTGNAYFQPEGAQATEGCAVVGFDADGHLVISQ